MTRKGGCQCGAVRYEVVGEPKQILVCHCTECQHQSGSAFGMAMVIDEASLRFTQGELKTYKREADSERKVLCAFCPQCGVRIYHKLEWRHGTISLKSGTLDETSWLKPQVHLWTGSKQSWVDIPENASVHEKQPSDARKT